MISQYEYLLFPLGIIFSLAMCFMGFKYLKGWVAFFGLVGGFCSGFLVAAVLLDLDDGTSLLIGLLAGIVVMLLSFLIFKVGIFVLTALLTAELVYQLPWMERIQEMYFAGSLGTLIQRFLPVFLVLLIAAAAGYAAVKMTRVVIIAVTGITGAYRAVMYFTAFINEPITADTQNIWMGVVILLAALGMVVQFFTTDKDK